MAASTFSSLFQRLLALECGFNREFRRLVLRLRRFIEKHRLGFIEHLVFHLRIQQDFLEVRVDGRVVVHQQDSAVCAENHARTSCMFGFWKSDWLARLLERIWNWAWFAGMAGFR